MNETETRADEIERLVADLSEACGCDNEFCREHLTKRITKLASLLGLRLVDEAQTKWGIRFSVAGEAQPRVLRARNEAAARRLHELNPNSELVSRLLLPEREVAPWMPALAAGTEAAK